MIMPAYKPIETLGRINVHWGKSKLIITRVWQITNTFLNPDINPCIYYKLIYNESAKAIQWGEGWFFSSTNSTGIIRYL